MAMEKFHYTSSTGVKITLPWIENAVPAGFYRKMRHRGLSEEDKVWEIIEYLADEETLEKIDGLTVSDFQEMIGKLTKGDIVPAGESTPS